MTLILDRPTEPLPPDSLDAVEPILEAGAYEELWLQDGMTSKKMADLFRGRRILPSEIAGRAKAEANAATLLKEFKSSGIDDWGIRLHRAGNYPECLRQAENPVELLYYAGDWNLAYQRSVSVVGTRKPTPEGLIRARKVVEVLVRLGVCIVSGLAAGIDTESHRTALKCGGATIAVIGTPLTRYYPKENEPLQRYLAKHYCVMTQVPLLRYNSEHFKTHRFWFPERNITMASLTEATVIVEASETSGTLTQARAALKQGKKVLILENNFVNPALTWPARFASQGAQRVKNVEDLERYLS